MSDVKGSAEIELRADKFSPGASKISQDIEKIGSSATKAGRDVEAGSEKAAAGIRKIGEESKKTSALNIALAGSFAGIATSAVGLVTSTSNITKAQISLNQSLVTRDTMQNRINKLEKAGKQDTEDYRIALDKLKVANEQVAQKQGDLNNIYISYFTMLGSTGVQTSTTIMSMITQQAKEAGISRSAYVKLRLEAIRSNSTLAQLVKTGKAFITSPIGIVALAAAGGFLAFDQNIGGLRTTLSKLTGIEIPSVLDSLGKMVAGPGSIPEVDEDLQNAQTSMEEARTSLENLSNTFNPTTTGAMSAFGSR